MALHLLALVLAPAQLSAVVEMPGTGALAIASLHPANGTVDKVHAPFATPGGGLSSSCNAAFDGERYFKATTSQMLTVDALTGKTLHAVTLTGGPPRYGSETFLAGPDADGLLYSAEPLSYTSFTIFSWNVTSGVVTEVATLPKKQLDGIGVCAAAVAGQRLVFMLADALVAFDLVGRKNVTRLTDRFYAPLAPDPSHPGSVLALTVGPASIDSAARETSFLTRVELATGTATTLFAFNATYYHRLCKCKLPIRPQDQADLAVSSDGRSAWAVLSYNEKPGPHGSLLARGSFAFDVGATKANLVGEAFAWDDQSPSPRIAVMRWVTKGSEGELA